MIGDPVIDCPRLASRPCGLSPWAGTLEKTHEAIERRRCAIRPCCAGAARAANESCRCAARHCRPDLRRDDFPRQAISSFLKIFVGIFSTETIVFGLAVVAARAGYWPRYFAQDSCRNRCLSPSRSSRFSSTRSRRSRLSDRSRASPTAILTPANQLAPASGRSPPIRHWNGASPWQWLLFSSSSIRPRSLSSCG